MRWIIDELQASDKLNHFHLTDKERRLKMTEWAEVGSFDLIWRSDRNIIDK